MYNVQKQFKKQPQLRQQKYYYPKNPIRNLGSKPTPFNFYTDVLVCNFDPKNMYPNLGIEYQCIHCGSKDLIFLGKN